MAFAIATAAAKLFTKIGGRELTTEEEETLVRNLFQRFDTDASGLLDPLEFGAMVKQLGFEMTPQEVKDVITGMDEDGNGMVDFKEFLNWYRGETENLSKVGQKKRAALLRKLRDDLALEEIDDVMGGFIPLWKQDDPNRLRAKEMFDQFDVHKNRTIDEAEFADMCLLLGLSWKKKRIAQEFEKIDTDNSHGISFDEWFKWWRDNRKKTNKDIQNDLSTALEDGFTKADFKKNAIKPKPMTFDQQREFFLTLAGSSFTPSFQSLTLLNKVQELVNAKFEAGGDVKAAINDALNEMKRDIGQRSAESKQRMDDYLNARTE
jgi:Ca2+-binding EF-hand superfamily protein